MKNKVIDPAVFREWCDEMDGKFNKNGSGPRNECYVNGMKFNNGENTFEVRANEPGKQNTFISIGSSVEAKVNSSGVRHRRSKDYEKY